MKLSFSKFYVSEVKWFENSGSFFESSQMLRSSVNIEDLTLLWLLRLRDQLRYVSISSDDDLTYPSE